MTTTDIQAQKKQQASGRMYNAKTVDNDRDRGITAIHVKRARPTEIGRWTRAPSISIGAARRVALSYRIVACASSFGS